MSDPSFDPKLLKLPIEFTKTSYKGEWNSPYMTQSYFEPWAGEDGTGLRVDLLSMGVIQKLVTGRVDVMPANLSEEDKKLLFASPTPQSSSLTHSNLPSNTLELSEEKKRELASVLTLPKVTRSQQGIAVKRAPAISSSNPEELKEDVDVTTREGQIYLIEKSFSVIGSTMVKEIKHPTDPNIKPLELLPVFPDFLSWGVEGYQVVYSDGDPMNGVKIEGDGERSGMNKIETKELMRKEALLKMVVDKYRSREKVLVYAIPSEQSVLDLARGREIGENYEYEAVKDYVQASTSNESRSVLFRVADKEGVYYLPTPTKWTLKRKRAHSKDAEQYFRDAFSHKPTHILAKYRRRTPIEKQERQERLIHTLADKNEATYFNNYSSDEEGIDEGDIRKDEDIEYGEDINHNDFVLPKEKIMQRLILKFPNSNRISYLFSRTFITPKLYQLKQKLDSLTSSVTLRPSSALTFDLLNYEDVITLLTDKQAKITTSQTLTLYKYLLQNERIVISIDHINCVLKCLLSPFNLDKIPPDEFTNSSSCPTDITLGITRKSDEPFFSQHLSLFKKIVPEDIYVLVNQIIFNDIAELNLSPNGTTLSMLILANRNLVQPIPIPIFYMSSPELSKIYALPDKKSFPTHLLRSVSEHYYEIAKNLNMRLTLDAYNLLIMLRGGLIPLPNHLTTLNLNNPTINPEKTISGPVILPPGPHPENIVFHPDHTLIPPTRSGIWEIFTSMKNNSVYPNILTYEALLSSFGRVKDSGAVWKIYLKLTTSTNLIRPKIKNLPRCRPETIASALEGFENFGEESKVNNLLKLNKALDFRLTRRSIHALMRFHIKRNDPIQAIQCVQKHLSQENQWMNHITYLLKVEACLALSKNLSQFDGMKLPDTYSKNEKDFEFLDDELEIEILSNSISSHPPPKITESEISESENKQQMQIVFKNTVIDPLIKQLENQTFIICKEPLAYERTLPGLEINQIQLNYLLERIFETVNEMADLQNKNPPSFDLFNQLRLHFGTEIFSTRMLELLAEGVGRVADSEQAWCCLKEVVGNENIVTRESAKEDQEPFVSFYEAFMTGWISTGADIKILETVLLKLRCLESETIQKNTKV
ncbi:hypothetical protein HK096_000026 [Nowakowskiella sp. JEL0078]|nr:hypothetical protein HK096_000026 [Nowakowskiella sp. JEL0078]